MGTAAGGSGVTRGGSRYGCEGAWGDCAARAHGGKEVCLSWMRPLSRGHTCGDTRQEKATPRTRRTSPSSVSDRGGSARSTGSRSSTSPPPPGGAPRRTTCARVWAVGEGRRRVRPVTRAALPACCTLSSSEPASSPPPLVITARSRGSVTVRQVSTPGSRDAAVVTPCSVMPSGRLPHSAMSVSGSKK